MCFVILHTMANVYGVLPMCRVVILYTVSLLYPRGNPDIYITAISSLQVRRQL